MKLPICGPSYKHVSIDVNNQRCLNLFPVSAGPDGRGETVLLPTPGVLEVADLSVSNGIRQLKTVGSSVYVVVGPSVYKLELNYVTRTVTNTTLLGSIGTSVGTVYIDANPAQVIFVDGSTEGYIYTVSSGSFAAIADTDFIGGTQVKFIDSYFVVNQPNTGVLQFSDQNDGTVWDAADVGTAESNTDNIIGLGVSKGELWVFGTRTTEIWYNAGNLTGAPFSPRDGLEIQIGCGAADSIVEIDDLLIWLDNRGFIVQSAVSPFIRSNNSGYDLKIISDEALTADILSYERRDDAIACSYNYKGHLMYQISFPTAKKTWVFDYTTKAWHERSYYNSFVQEHEHHLFQYATILDSLHIVAGIRNGKVYLSDERYLDDNGEDIRRIRSTPISYDPELYKLVAIDSLDIRLETGRAEPTDREPQVSMRYSHDGGHTWSDYMNRSFGAIGEYAKPIRWNRLGIGREWMFEFSIVEPVKFSIIDANVSHTDVEI